MIAKPTLPKATSFIGPTVIALTCVLCEFVGRTFGTDLRLYPDALSQGRFWQLITGHFVHMGGAHLALNLFALFSLPLLSGQSTSPRDWLVRSAVLAVVTSLFILRFEPDLAWYVGFSGVVHGLYVLELARPALQRDLIAGVALAGLVGKLLWETYHGTPLTGSDALLGGVVVLEAHLYGVVAAIGYGVLMQSFTSPDDRLFLLTRRD